MAAALSAPVAVKVDFVAPLPNWALPPTSKEVTGLPVPMPTLRGVGGGGELRLA